jgi:uncharacterized membrane protein YsdA (DUF1294 family)
MKGIIWYFFAVSILSFALFGIDKRRAVHHAWRIPEAVLLWSAALGGSAGALLGIACFRHKTQKPKFRYGIPLILVLQLLAAAWLLHGQQG